MYDIDATPAVIAAHAAAMQSLVPEAGDADSDFDVDAADLASVGLHWGPSATDRMWQEGDFDADGDVDATDLAAVGLAWSPGGYGFGAAAPEPGTSALVGFGLCALAVHCRRPGRRGAVGG